MDPDDWMGGGNDGERERDNYSYEDSEQFDEDDMYSMGTDEGGSRRDDWDGWEGEGGGGGGGDRNNEREGEGPLGGSLSLSLSLFSFCCFHPRSHSLNQSIQWREIIQSHPASSFPSLKSIAVKSVFHDISPSPSFPFDPFSHRACARHLTFYALEDSYKHATFSRYLL
ncbi:hypothetical protein PENTCL1PPCAC_17756, partial [Pristionchus entomophagus]